MRQVDVAARVQQAARPTGGRVLLDGTDIATLPAKELARALGLLPQSPISFLDIFRCVEVLDLVADLNHSRGTTVLMVLHDLNLAARYCDWIIAMRAGAVVAKRPPADIVTEALVEEVFGIGSRVIADPVSGSPLVVPIGRHRIV